MSTTPEHPSRPAPAGAAKPLPSQDKQDRLAQALRDNLKRRKAAGKE